MFFVYIVCEGFIDDDVVVSYGFVVCGGVLIDGHVGWVDVG